MKTTGYTFAISIGSYGGFYISNLSQSVRVCLGWIAFTFFYEEIDNIFNRLVENTNMLREGYKVEKQFNTISLRLVQDQFNKITDLTNRLNTAMELNEMLNKNQKEKENV